MESWDREDYGHIPPPVNVTQKAVRRVLFERLDRGALNCCACEACLINIQAVALNRLRSWYVRGELLLQDDEWPSLMNVGFPTRKEVEQAVSQAIERVSMFPKKVAHAKALVLPW
jgi:hypothetical protein